MIAGGQGLGEHEPHRRRLLAGARSDAGEGRPKRALGLSPLGLAGLSRPLQLAVGDRAHGLGEAIVAVGELLVEGAPRDPGQPDHLAHRHVLVAGPGDGLDHRALDPGSLVAGDLAGVEAVRTAGKLPVDGCDAFA